MSDSTWPDIAILIITYDRPKEIRLTIEALQRYLRYEGDLYWRVADDGSPDGYLRDIRDSFPALNITVSRTERRGWGANVNRGIALLDRRYYFFLIEDDYVAQRNIDLTSGMALLRALPDLGVVRYDGLAGHGLDLDLRETNTAIGRMNYLRLRKSSPCLNVYSNRPHLTAPHFHESYGMYVEGWTLGQTEEEFAHRVKDKKGPDIASLVDGIPLAFDHIGRTRQNTVEDVHGN